MPCSAAPPYACAGQALRVGHFLCPLVVPCRRDVTTDTGRLKGRPFSWR